MPAFFGFLLTLILWTAQGCPDAFERGRDDCAHNRRSEDSCKPYR